MKLLSIIAIFVTTLALADGGPRFSAFVFENELHVTLMADSCNDLFPSLTVANFCHEDRQTRNLAFECDVKFDYSTTKMNCGDSKLIPRVLSVKLKEAKVAHEAKSLNLEYDGQTVLVEISQ